MDIYESYSKLGISKGVNDFGEEILKGLKESKAEQLREKIKAEWQQC